MYIRIIIIILLYVVKKSLELSFSDLINQELLTSLWLLVLLLLESTRSFTIYRFFYITITVFLYSRIILQVMGLNDFEYLSLFVTKSIDENNYLKVLHLMDYIMFILAIWQEIVLKIKIGKFYGHGKRLNLLFKHINFPLTVCTLILCSVVIYFDIKVVLLVYKFGYLALFNGTIGDTIAYKISTLCFRILVVLMILNWSIITSKKSSVKLINALFIITLLLESFKGQRGHTMLWLLFMIYIFLIWHKNKFSIKLVLGMFSLAIIMLFGASIAREENSEVLGDLLYTQGISLEVPLLVLEKKNELLNTGDNYLFGPTFDYVNRNLQGWDISGRTKSLVEHSEYLGYDLIYFTNPKAFYAGFGTGSSIIGELLLTKLPGINFVLILLIVEIVRRFEVMFLFGKFIAPYVFMKFWYMPRDSFYKFPQDLIFGVLTTVLLMSLWVLLKSVFYGYSKVNY